MINCLTNSHFFQFQHFRIFPVTMAELSTRGDEKLAAARIRREGGGKISLSRENFSKVHFSSNIYSSDIGHKKFFHAIQRERERQEGEREWRGERGDEGKKCWVASGRRE